MPPRSSVSSTIQSEHPGAGHECTNPHPPHRKQQLTTLMTSPTSQPGAVTDRRGLHNHHTYVRNRVDNHCQAGTASHAATVTIAQYHPQSTSAPSSTTTPPQPSTRCTLLNLPPLPPPSPLRPPSPSHQKHQRPHPSCALKSSHRTAASPTPRP